MSDHEEETNVPSPVAPPSIKEDKDDSDKEMVRNTLARLSSTIPSPHSTLAVVQCCHTPASTVARQDTRAAHNLTRPTHPHTYTT